MKKKNKFYELANSFRGPTMIMIVLVSKNYSKSQKTGFFKSKSKSNEKNGNNIYDTINIDNISILKKKITFEKRY